MDIYPYGRKEIYSPKQWQLWLVLLDAFNATQFGFTKHRMPMPGQSIDISKATEHISAIEDEWTKEWQKRDVGYPRHYSDAPALTEMPILAQAYYAEEINKIKAQEAPSAT